jgi:hypothetical protein
MQVIYVEILKIHYLGKNAGLLQREGKYSGISLSIADIFFINKYN